MTTPIESDTLEGPMISGASGDPLCARRFWAKVDTAGPDDCWVWRGTLRKGYGGFWNGGKVVGAHRLSVILSGRDIPEGMVVDHICRRPACVNPAHLRVVTVRENTIENSNSLSSQRSKSATCQYGHPLSGSNLGRTTSGHRRCIACNTRRCSERRAAARKVGAL